jgi:UDP-2,4-diacetamido-2,4,6-trideoxy-beta-L-altropyranose hydrolase
MLSGVDVLDDAATRLLLRTVASADRGFGHAMRCLALAERWLERGGTVVTRYLAGLDAHRERFEEAGIEDVATPVKTAAQIVDGVELSPDEGCSIPTLVIDDNGDRILPVGSIVLNPNAHASALWYPAHKHPLVFLGPQHAPLRAHYRRAPASRVPSRCERLLISFGGADPADQARRVLATLDAPIPSISAIDIVVGPACPFADYSAFMRRSWGGPPVIVHRAPRDLVALMQSARLVLSSCGSTVWELCALQRAFLCGATVPHEAALGAWLSRSLGSDASLDYARASENDIAERVRDLSANDGWLDDFSRRAAHLCDGRGAVRVVDALWSEATGRASRHSGSLADGKC